MSATVADAGSLFLLLLALGGEALMGEMRWLFRRVPHPRFLVGQLVDLLEPRLNRDLRGTRARLVRGALVAVIVMVLALGAGLGVAVLTRNVPFLLPVEFLVMMSLVAQRGPHDRVAEAAKLMDRGSLLLAQEALRPVAGLGPGALDGLGLPGTVRIGALALARAFVHGVAAPCFWYVLLGLPGLCLQQAVLVMAVRLQGSARDDPRYRDFGLAAIRLNEALTLLPAALAALVLGLAAIFVPKAHPVAALTGGWGRRQGPAGWPTSAMAAALGLDQVAGPAELDRARMLYAVACLINAGLIAALALLLLSV